MLLGTCRDEKKASTCLYGVHTVGDKVLPGYLGPLNSQHSCVPAARHPAEPKWGGFKVLSLPLSFPGVITAAPRSAFSGFFLSCWFSILLKCNRRTGVLWPQIYSGTAEKKLKAEGRLLFFLLKLNLAWNLAVFHKLQSAFLVSLWWRAVDKFYHAAVMQGCASPPRPPKYFISAVC